MADYSALRDTINNNIVPNNGRQEITGAKLNSVLNSMVDVLGEGYTFLGVATISTNPTTPEGKAYYLAGAAGTYRDFGNIVVASDEVALLVWDGTAWSKVVSTAASKEEVRQLGQDSANAINLSDKLIRKVTSTGWSIGHNSGYIDADGNIQAHGGYLTSVFPTKDLLSIRCKIGNSGSNGYGIAFYSSKDTLDNTTFISDGSRHSQVGVYNDFSADIPANAEVVLISCRLATLPADQIEIELDYGNQPDVTYERDIFASTSAKTGVTQDFSLDIYADTTIAINNPLYFRPLYVRAGDTLHIKMQEDASSILTDGRLATKLIYADGTISDTYMYVSASQYSVRLCEKDVIGLCFYSPRTAQLADGIIHFTAFVRATEVRVITKSVSLQSGQFVNIISYANSVVIGAKKGQMVKMSITATGLSRIAIYYFEEGTTTRIPFGEIVIGKTLLFRTPYNLHSLGFYSSAVSVADNVVINIEVYDDEDFLSLPTWYNETYMVGKINRIKELIADAGGNVFSFAFVTDEHIDYLVVNQKSPALIKRLCEDINLDAVVNGGDIANGWGLFIQSYVDALYEASAKSKLFNVVGNHEYQNSIDDGDIYLYYQWNNFEKHGNPSRGYYYRDDELQKVRMVFLNAFIDNGASAGAGYENEQVQWFANEALNTPSEWKIVVFTHNLYIVPIYSDSTYYPYRLQSGAEPIMAAIKANNEAEGKGKVLLCVQGHTHNDRIMTAAVTGSVPVVITASDAVLPNLDSQGRPDHNVDRNAGTISEQVIDVFVLNLSSNTANIVRIGADARDGLNESQGSNVQERTIAL